MYKFVVKNQHSTEKDEIEQVIENMTTWPISNNSPVGCTSFGREVLSGDYCNDDGDDDNKNGKRTIFDTQNVVINTWANHEEFDDDEISFDYKQAL